MGIGLVSDLGGQGYYTSYDSINCDSSVNIRQDGICFPNTTAKKDLFSVCDIGRRNYGLTLYRNSTSLRLPMKSCRSHVIPKPHIPYSTS